MLLGTAVCIISVCSAVLVTTVTQLHLVGGGATLAASWGTVEASSCAKSQSDLHVEVEEQCIVMDRVENRSW